MKKLIILSAIALSGLIYNTADAQIHFGLSIRPRVVVYAHAPVMVQQTPVYPQQAYDGNDDYYYLPDVDAYYNVNDQCYFYFDGNDWISAAYLPGAYSNYDWRSAPRYEVRAPRPYLRDDFYRSKYNGRPVSEWAHNNYNNHFDGGYANRDNNRNQHFDNRQQGNYNQHAQPGWNQRDNNQHFDNRGQNRNDQHSNDRGNNGRDTRGRNDHNSPQGGFANHRMTKF